MPHCAPVHSCGCFKAPSCDSLRDPSSQAHVCLDTVSLDMSVCVSSPPCRVRDFFLLTARQQPQEAPGRGQSPLSAGASSGDSMDSMDSSADGHSWELPRVGHAPGFERYEVRGQELRCGLGGSAGSLEVRGIQGSDPRAIPGSTDTSQCAAHQLTQPAYQPTAPTC